MAVTPNLTSPAATNQHESSVVSGVSSHDNDAAMNASSDATSALAKFVSNHLINRIASGNVSLTPQDRRFRSAILFADVSGFTDLTERLAEQFGAEQAIGAEHLTLMLSEYFDCLIETVYACGGDVIKFAGDAVLILFSQDDAQSVLRTATMCAVNMQAAAAEVSERLEHNHNVSLSLKIAVSYGEVRELIVGGVLNRWEYAIVSDALSEIGKLSDLAEPNHVIISSENLARLKSTEIQVEPQTNEAFNIVATPNWPLPLKMMQSELSFDQQNLVKNFVPAAVASRISAGQHDVAIISELRTVSVLFINLPNFSPDIALNEAQAIVTRIQQVCYGQRGSLDKISSDDKGVSIIAGFGVPPMSAEDDAERAVKAAINVKRLLNEQGVEVAIGVATGPVYCGTLGDAYRREYTLMGDGVNTAARLMSKAGSGILCDEHTMLACIESINFSQAQLLSLKGKTGKVSVYSPLAIKETATATPKAVFGRDQELKALSNLLSKSDLPKTVCGILIGGAGIGKTALLNTIEHIATREHRFNTFRTSARATQISFYGVWRELLYQALGFDELTSSTEKQQTLLTLSMQNSAISERMLPLLNEMLAVNFNDSAQLQRLQNELRAENTHYLVRQILKSKNDRLLIIIDDAHWMDSASWLLLETLVRELKNAVFLVASQEFTSKEPISFTRLKSSRTTMSLTLAPLQESEIKDLMSEQLNVDEIHADASRLVFERCEGNPHYAKVLTKDLVERDLFNIEARRCVISHMVKNTDDIELPSSLENALAGQLERLDLDQQLAIKTASVMGRQFTIDALHHIYPVQKNREELNHDFDQLSAVGMTQALVRHVDYLFTHTATQKIAYDLMLYRQRKKMHRQIAQWMQANDKSISDNVAELAEHWFRAEEYEQALHYYGRAIEEAHQLFANRETLQYLGKIRLITENDNININNAKLAEWIAMGGAAKLALGSPEKAERSFNKALSLLGIKIPATQLGFALRAVKEIALQQKNKHLPTIKRSVAQEKVADTHMAAMIMQRQFLVYFYRKKMAGLFYSAFATTNLSESTGERTPTLSRSYATLGHALAGIPLRKTSRGYIARALSIAKEVDDPETWSWFYLAAGMCHAQYGEWQAHTKAMNQCRRIAMDVGDRRRWEEATAVRTIANLLSGDFDPANVNNSVYQQIHQSGVRRGVQQAQSWGLCMWLIAALVQGEYERAHEIAPTLEQLHVDSDDNIDPVNIVEACSSFAILALRDQQFDHAYQQLGVSAAQIKDWGRPTTWRSIVGCYHHAEAVLRLWWHCQHHQPTLPASATTQVTDWLKQALKLLKAHATIYDIGVPRYRLVLGWYYLMQNKPKQAERHWSEGLEQALALNMNYDVLLINLAAKHLENGARFKLSSLACEDTSALANKLMVRDPDWVADWRGDASATPN